MKYYIEEFIKLYKHHNKRMLYGLLIVGLSLKFNPWVDANTASLAALSAAAVILVLFVMEIYEVTVLKVEPTIWFSIHEAKHEIEKTICDYVRSKRGKHTTIRCLGVVLFRQWPVIEGGLIQLLKDGHKDVTIDLVMLDPSWKKLRKFNPSWPSYGSHAKLMIADFQKKYSEELRNLGWKVGLEHYQEVPHWYGIMLDQQILFLGAAFWNEKGHLEAGSDANILERYNSSDARNGRDRMAEFRGWFEHFKKGDEEKLASTPVNQS